MKVNVKVELYQDQIRRLTNAVTLSAEQAAEAVKSDIDASQTVPKNTGELERSGFVRVSKSRFQIIYDTPYARRLYWHPEYKFRKDKNPNAGGLWMQPYIDGEKKDFFKKAFRARLKVNAGGLIK